MTYLDLSRSFQGVRFGFPPASATAFSALTASSKLQHLNIADCMLPAGVWQHVFPAGRRLPRLHTLLMECFVHRPSSPAIVLEGSRLVSCCPGLQYLDMRHLKYTAELLDPLPGLSNLRTLLLSANDATKGLPVEVVGRFPQLRHLVLDDVYSSEEWLLHVTHLKRLTYLDYVGLLNGQLTALKLARQVRLQVPGWLVCTSGTCCCACQLLLGLAYVGLGCF
jgi:hypothetical protein